MTTRLILVGLLAVPLTVHGQAADTADIRRLAGEAGIDTTKAQLRVRGDTAWVWARRDSRYSRGMELRRQNGQWVRHSEWATSSAMLPPAHRPRPTAPTPRDTNWVDTIVVGRLPTGGCEWAKVRLRSGNRGTTTTAGRPSEKTCTVLAYNVTTGSEQDRPAVVGFGYVQDRKMTLPPNAVLNFADTFTVARRPDGECDWGKTPARPGPNGSASMLGEARVKDCWGVVYNVNLAPRQNATGPGRADTATTVFIAPGSTGLDRAEVGWMVDTVRKLLKNPSAVLQPVALTGNRARVTAAVPETDLGHVAFVTYHFEKRRGRWVLLPQRDTTRTP